MYTGGKENKGNREDEKAWQRERPKAEQLDKIAFTGVAINSAHGVFPHPPGILLRGAWLG